MKHVWLTPSECSCGLIAHNERHVQTHNRSNRSYRKRKKKRGRTYSRKQ